MRSDRLLLTRPGRRLAPALLVLGVLLGQAPAADAPRPPRLDAQSYTLPNGLKVVLHRDPTVPRVTVCVAYHVGAKNERAGRTGFAHFFEHMMFRGTKNVPNYDIPLQEAGAQSNAFTSEDMTVYFETVPSEFLERALYLEAERLAFLPSALDQAKFDTEREVVKNERRQSYENVPYGLAEETLLANVFPAGSPYSWSVIGSMKDLGAATLDDLKRFFAEFYHPANATLCLAGDFDPAQARALIETYFSPLVAGPVPPPVVMPRTPPVAKRLELTDDVQLARLYLTWPTVADDHPDAPALDLLATILADGEASRLQQALVREGRVASAVNASSDTREAAGTFGVQATVAEGIEPAKLEAAVQAELKRLTSVPPTPAELERALAKFEQSSFAQLTAPLARAVTLAVGFAQKNDPEYYRKEFERYYQVKVTDLDRVARKYLTPETVVLWIKPGEDQSIAVQAGPKPDNRPEPALVTREPKGGPDWSQMPGPAPSQPFAPPKVQRHTLSNGVEVWAASWHILPVAQIRLLLPAGTADDPKDHAGLATLTAALLDKGTKRLTAPELAEAFDALGVSFGVAPGLEHTSVSLSSLARNLEPALKLTAEVLTQPRFDPTDFDRERQLQLTDLLQGPDDPAWIAQRAFRSLLYGQDHPYGSPADGFPSTVKALTLDDVKAFHRDRMVPKGAILIAVGDFEPEALFAQLEKTLAGWKGDGAPRREIPAAPKRAEPGTVYLVDKPGAVQSVLSVGRRWAGRRDPRYFETLIGNRILGGDFLSRLNQNLRERNGFTYGAGSVFTFRKGQSVWAVRTQVRADASAPALREVIGELNGLLDGTKPFTTEELGTAIGAERQSFPDQFESPTGLAGALSELAVNDLPADDFDTFLSRLQAAKPEAIGRTMAELVAPGERTVLVVGDRKAVEPKLKELGFETIVPISYDGKPLDGK